MANEERIAQAVKDMERRVVKIRQHGIDLLHVYDRVGLHAEETFEVKTFVHDVSNAATAIQGELTLLDREMTALINLVDYSKREGTST